MIDVQNIRIRQNNTYDVKVKKNSTILSKKVNSIEDARLVRNHFYLQLYPHKLTQEQYDNCMETKDKFQSIISKENTHSNTGEKYITFDENKGFIVNFKKSFKTLQEAKDFKKALKDLNILI